MLFVVRARCNARIRPFSCAAHLRDASPPKPPKPIYDSTSALDYKRVHKIRPPPLPAMDLPRSRSAEEAVTNILYNTPPPSLQPFKKCVAFSSSSFNFNISIGMSSTASYKTSLVFYLVFLEFSRVVGLISILWLSAEPKYAT